MAEVDKERGRIGLRLADDPEIAGKSVDELKALAATSAGGGGGRRAAVTAATAVIAAAVTVTGWRPWAVVAVAVVRVASIAIPATTTSRSRIPVSQGSVDRAHGAGLAAAPCGSPPSRRACSSRRRCSLGARGRTQRDDRRRLD